MHLLRIVPGLKLVAIHPDGEPAKTFDFLGRLGKQGASFGRRPSAWRTTRCIKAPDVPVWIHEIKHDSRRSWPNLQLQYEGQS